MSLKSNKIFLIGFMGSGKSFMGQHLANALNWSFLDLDAFLEEKEKRSIARIFVEEGEALFRKLEQQHLKNTSEIQNYIIATGGGAPCFFDNMHWMNENGLTIYLKTPVPILVNRLKSEKGHRPLIAGKTDKEMSRFIKEKLAEREYYYQRAHIIFEYTSGLETEKDLRKAIGFQI